MTEVDHNAPLKKTSTSFTLWSDTVHVPLPFSASVRFEVDTYVFSFWFDHVFTKLQS